MMVKELIEILKEQNQEVPVCYKVCGLYARLDKSEVEIYDNCVIIG